ncbi:MAG: response regulator [Gammaproteobacteria bacterium]|nr:response regulator [Gammaproteobacteria bacterium]
MNHEAKKKLTFLVVDDYEPMARTIRRALVDMGFREIELATNGSQALKLLQQQPFDYVVTDMEMPQVDGCELTKKIRGGPKTGTIPVLMVTGESEKSRIVAAISSGVTDIMLKPFSPHTFRKKIEGIISGKMPLTLAQRGGRAGKESGGNEEKKRVEVEKRTVLVVDDTVANIEVLTGILGEIYRVKAATSGKKALQICQRNPPDLILLDIMMPEMDGYEVCNRLKKGEFTANIPVIFLTAKGETEDMTRGFAEGAVDYISKPALPAILKARVKAQMALRERAYALEDALQHQIENARLLEDVSRMTRHDLKGPLAVALAALNTLTIDDLIAQNDRRVLAQEGATALQQVLEMINRSFDLHKMETGSYQYTAQPVQLGALLQGVIRGVVEMADKKRVTIDLRQGDEEVVAAGEEMLCFSLFSNLIKNAVEASPSSGRVGISVARQEMTEVVIHNRGVIPEKIRTRFFEKYVTADKKGGTGLGSYSAKLMTTVMGGKISFDSNEENGTTLRVKLPVAEAEAG